MALSMRATQAVANGRSVRSAAPVVPARRRVVARADPDAVDAAVNTTIEALKATGQAVKGGIELLGAGAKVIKDGYEVASPYIQQGVEAVTPAVTEAVKAATPVVTKAVPIVQDTLTGAVKSAGVDLDALSRTAATAAQTATEGAAAAEPYVTQAASFLSSSTPVELAEYGAGAVALYLLAPSLVGLAVGGLRGYAGGIGAVQALEALNEGAVLIDIRTESEKESGGVPDVPGGSNKVVEVELASVADRKLRGALRDVGFLEAQITALQIAALKRIGRGSKVLLLDRNGGNAKTVAKELTKLGFRKVYVIDGGFGGWVSSKLLVKPVVGSLSNAAAPNLARTISSRSFRRQLSAPKQ